MALRFDDYLFFHIPRSGGNYVRAMVQKNLNPKHINEVEFAHCTPLNTSVWMNYTNFTTIRSPFSWYCSYFKYRLLKGWRDGQQRKERHFIDLNCRAPDLNNFIDKMMIYFPYGFYNGYLARVLPFVDYAIPLSELTRGMNVIMDGIFSESEIVQYKQPEIKDINTTHMSIDEGLTPEIITLFVTREVEPFRRMVNHYSGKIWFIDEVLEELKTL